MARAARIDDAGVKIGGARKDFAARRLGLDDLDAMTNEEAVALVARDNVWPQPDWEALVEGGMSPRRAATIRMIRSKIAKLPSFRRGDDPTAARRSYVTIISALRDLVEDPELSDDGLAREAQLRMDRAFPRPESHIVLRGRYLPWNINASERQRIDADLEAGWPGKAPVWGRNVRLMQDPRTKETSFIAVRSGQLLLKDGYPTREALEAALAEAFSKAGKAAAVEKAKPKVPPDRPHLDSVRREGPSVRDGDVGADDFVAVLGFRGVEFGNWVAQDERQSLLNMGWDAVHDLAEVIGVEPRDISLGGSLAIAFGARGQSGRAAAHYEPGRRVFNMTKLSGAGSLAHEWAHALDHWAGSVGFSGASLGVRGATGWYDRTKDFFHRLENLRPEERAAWSAVTDTLYQKVPTAPEFADGLRRAKAEREAEMTRVDEMVARYEASVAAGGRGRDPKWERKVAAWRANETTSIARRDARIQEVLASGKVPAGTLVATDFFREATKLVGGAKSSGGQTPYWTRPTELFARSFECFVFDTIKSWGRSSDYLVHGVEPGRYDDGDLFKGNPYPVGDERTEINRIMRQMVEAMAARIRQLGVGSALEASSASDLDAELDQYEARFGR